MSGIPTEFIVPSELQAGPLAEVSWSSGIVALIFGRLRLSLTPREALHLAAALTDASALAHRPPNQGRPS